MSFLASRKDLKENRGNKNNKDHKSQFLVAKTCVKNQRETERGLVQKCPVNSLTLNILVERDF